jgi:acyl carrier protein
MKERIRTFLQETFFLDAFADDDSFLKTGLIDSTGMLELISFVEKAFEIKIEDAELLPENLDSLSQLGAFIERKRACRPRE